MEQSTGIRNAHILGRQMLEDERNRKFAFESVTQCGTVGNGNITQMKPSTNRVCHAGLNMMYTNYAPSKVVDLLMKSSLSDEKRLAWYSFILERSVYSSMFAERRAKKGMQRGYFVYHADVNANILVAGAVAIRMASEKDYIVEYFYNLVKAGADEDVAFLAAHSLGGDDPIEVGVGGQISHVAIAPFHMEQDNLRRYFLADVEKYPFYSVESRYFGINRMFGETWERKRDYVYFVPELSRRWVCKVQDMAHVDKRVALFNLDWNRKEVLTYALPAEQTYPLLAKILNDYKQEILNNEA